MARFLVDRLLQSIVVILVLSFVIYAMIGLMPGDPIDLMVNSDPDMTSADGPAHSGQISPLAWIGLAG